MSILFSIIAAIIHIGDIDFVEDYSDRHMAANSKVSNYQQLKISKLYHFSVTNPQMNCLTDAHVNRGTQSKNMKNSCIRVCVKHRE